MKLKTLGILMLMSFTLAACVKTNAQESVQQTEWTYVSRLDKRKAGNVKLFAYIAKTLFLFHNYIYQSLLLQLYFITTRLINLYSL